jgi:hypothetical protein
MAENEEVMRDAGGKPIARLRASGEDSRCSFCHLVLDMSGIGLPQTTPLNACSREGDSYIRWHMGSLPLAPTQKSLTPAEAAAVLNADYLRSVYRGFRGPASGQAESA